MMKINDNMNSKITDILKLTFTIMTLIAGLMYFIISNTEFDLPVYLIISVMFFFGAAILGVVAHLPSSIEFLHPKPFYEGHFDEELDDIIEVAAVTIADTITLLEVENKNKAGYFLGILILIVIGLGFLFFAFTMLI